ncbi:MAG: tRNA lysidine(34) synthetase TilS [Verrucomicrobia bacterium]|nr:tRNA lysidine(34) synthetase TilS [Verrucomicrobiota bacterium]MCH8513134.1 tRNA lysidine(34) synthetase TilS [Kiritimatiellia bacterium]
MSFFSPFIQNARDRELFPLPLNRTLVACSGGMDSVFLLHVLWHCRKALNLDLCVVTCDHGLRPDSAADAEWVRKLAWSLGLPCHWMELEVPANRDAKESVEMAARRLRLDAFAKLAEETGADAVALGHHLDDQAETVLMRLCRGTGPRGAAGMRWVQQVGPLRLVRPLLETRRETLEALLGSWGRTWREDASNRDPAFARNRVRQEIFPFLETKLNAETRLHLAVFAEQQRELDEWVSRQAMREYHRCLVGDGLDLRMWRKLPAVMRLRILLSFLQQSGVEVSGVSRKRWRDFEAALIGPSRESRQWQFGGVVLVAEGGKLLPLSANISFDPVSLAVPGEVNWPPLSRTITATMAKKVDRKASAVTEIHESLTAFCRPPAAAFEIRVPGPGDRYSPLGLQGSAKLSDLFINARIPARIRKRWPVVTCGGEIVWVPGFRVAEAWKAGEDGPCVRVQLGASTN